MNPKINTKNTMAETIKNYALALGYENCGIVPISQMYGYAEKLQERMADYPDSADYYKKYFRFAFPQIQHPWAKAIVICIRDYGKYQIPDKLQEYFGRFYLTDFRYMKTSEGYKASIEFENFLKGLGIQTYTNRENGVTPLRWAALMAGLGIIRKNNFFYTEHCGSFVHLEGFLIDVPLELTYTNRYFNCPEDCTLCIDACRTKALAKPYTLNTGQCTAFRTTTADSSPFGLNSGNWIYGCDDCQNACPYNYYRTEGTVPFPGLDELKSILSYEQIISMSDFQLYAVFYSKFPHISKDKLYQWKINVLNAVLNNYRADYAPLIQKALYDENFYVRNMARKISLKIGKKIRK